MHRKNCVQALSNVRMCRQCCPLSLLRQEPSSLRVRKPPPKAFLLLPQNFFRLSHIKKICRTIPYRTKSFQIVENVRGECAIFFTARRARKNCVGVTPRQRRPVLPQTKNCAEKKEGDLHLVLRAYFRNFSGARQ